MQIKRTLATIVSRIVVDLGTGSGKSIKHLLEVMKKGFIIGLDGSCKRLATAKKMMLLREILTRILRDQYLIPLIFL